MDFVSTMNHDQLMNDGCKIHKHSPNPKVIVVEKSHSYRCVSEKLGEMTLLDAGGQNRLCAGMQRAGIAASCCAVCLLLTHPTHIGQYPSICI